MSNESAKLDNDLLYLFAEGNYYHMYETFGVHFIKENGKKGAQFNVWAPGALSVCVTGDFCGWSDNGWFLSPVASTGVWTGFIEGFPEDTRYKFIIVTDMGEKLYKADPFAFYAEQRPATASIAHTLKYRWHDKRWMTKRAKTDHFKTPKNIYEVHLGSWMQHETDDPDPDNTDRFYTYRELAGELVPYVKEMGYSHIEILPVMEHPFDGSWGYQTTGYYAATSRYGAPEDFMYLIDTCHAAGIGVILDWVPGHFCRDAHGLAKFNGHMLYENEEHPNWGTFKFDYGRGEVKSFLLSNAMFWLEQYHADGIRVDGVSSMLYLNFGIDDPAQKKYNMFGEEKNLEAMEFLRCLSDMVGEYFPGVCLIAEESTAWPLVTYPPKDGGLGFHYKWDMGWMNDTLHYMQADFPYRKGCHDMLTFSMMYAFNENFILPLSHDEVVHGKCSLIGRMPGDYWRQFAGLRLLAMYQITHPGGKLNFMGNEIGQFIEWKYTEGLEWFMLDYESHAKHREFIKALNNMYLKEKALWECDHDWRGFEWIDADNSEQCVYSYIRKNESERELLITILNSEVNPIEGFRIGVPKKGVYRELLSSDDKKFGGSGVVNEGAFKAESVPYHGKPYSILVTVPPLGGSIFKRFTK